MLDQIRRDLSYDPESGRFYRLRSSTRFVGTVAGSKNKLGYREIRWRGRRFLAHRLAWLFMKGQWPVNQIDHKNGNKDDNRWTNLRSATPLQNSRNVGTHKDNASGFKGVFRSRARWTAQICVAGQKLHLGVFETPQAAAAAYVRASKKFHGEFGRSA